MERLLERSGYTLDTLLGLGERFALEENQGSGGITIDVTDRVHLENQELAIHAADTLGLNIAGIDFITNDIGISWKQAGGAILEVNDCPCLDLHTWPAEGQPRNVADIIVESMFLGDNQGRIPTAVVVGGGQLNGQVARVLNDLLCSAGMTIGLVIEKNTFVNGVRTDTKTASTRQAIRSLLRYRRLEGLISTDWVNAVLERGLIHDACSVAALLGFPTDANIQARRAFDVVRRATRGRLVVEVETALALEIDGAVDLGRTILVSRPTDDDAARHYLEAHLESGGEAVVTTGNRDARAIVLRRGNRTVAFLPIGAIRALAEHRSRRQLDAHMYAVALANGLGLSGETITSALCGSMPLRIASERPPGSLGSICHVSPV